MMICKFVRQTKSYGRVGHPENFLGVNLQKPTRNIAQIMNINRAARTWLVDQAMDI